jgi:hypothetical protein
MPICVAELLVRKQRERERERESARARERERERDTRTQHTPGVGEPLAVYGDCEFVVRWRTALACPIQVLVLFKVV